MSVVDILLILIVILIIVLVWRGPSMLPQFGEALGKAVKGARDTMDRDSDADAGASEAASQEQSEDDTSKGGQ